MPSPLVSNREQRKLLAQMLTPRTQIVGIPLPDWHKNTTRSAVLGTTATGGDLGLANTAGINIVGTSTNNTSATDAMRMEMRLPEGYATGGAITLKIRARVVINRQVAQTIGVSVKEVLDSTVGSELNATSTVSLTTSYADYGFSITQTDLVAGDILAIVVTATNNDTGGAAGAALIGISKTWLEFQGT